jgi:carboxypeptidase T
MARTSVLAALALALVPPARADWNDQTFDGSGGRDEAPVVALARTGPAASPDKRLWVVAKAADKAERTRAANAGLAIEEIGSGAVAGVATPSAVERLLKAGVAIVGRQPLKSYAQKGFPPADSAYHTFDQVQAALAAIAAAHKDVASLIVLGTTTQGRPITALRFNTTARGTQPSDKPGAAFLGTHHAREHLSTEVPLMIAQWLADNVASEDVKKLLENRDVYFIPLINPDGAEYDIATGDYKWFRKNMRANSDGSFGVDLNRNYDSHWGEAGDSGDPGDDTYRGPAAFSEPESRAMKKFFEDRPNLKTAVSYHTFAELILYPWSWGDEAIPDAAALQAFQAMGARMSTFTGYTSEQSSALYASSGDACDWAWAERKVFCFTFEMEPKSTSEGGFYPGVGAISTAFKGNLQSALFLIDAAGDPYRAGASASVAAAPGLPPPATPIR